MRMRISSLLVGAVLLTGVGTAAAQTVVITPEQDTVVREYIVKQKVTPVAPPSDVEIAIGTTLPETVEVRPLEVPDMKYEYVVFEGRTVLVEPGTRKVVHVISE